MPMLFLEFSFPLNPEDIVVKIETPHTLFVGFPEGMPYVIHILSFQLLFEIFQKFFRILQQTFHLVTQTETMMAFVFVYHP